MPVSIANAHTGGYANAGSNAGTHSEPDANMRPSAAPVPANKRNPGAKASWAGQRVRMPGSVRR